MHPRFWLLGLLSALPTAAAPLPDGVAVRGWTILSDSLPDDATVISAAPGYHINHLELSDRLMMELRQLRDPARARAINGLIDQAHAAGIEEVAVWDHALYDLSYYPSRFLTGPGGTLDFDNPDFWAWLKADYRDLLDRAPAADAVVLTFVQTGAHAEDQHSVREATPAARLAAVVNAIADVVVGERHRNLYARTLASSRADSRVMFDAVARFRSPKIRLMMKETIEDFLLTTPREPMAGRIPRATLMEFDAAGEMNGQGIIANTWPEYYLDRWKDFQSRPHVIGYTARTDRYGDTRLVGRPGEINLLALRMASEDSEVTARQVYATFIGAHYGEAALPDLEAAFRTAFDVVTSELYTLGNCTANHSHLDYEPYDANYINYAGAKWREPPTLEVAHSVDRRFQGWSDVIQHIAPAAVKDPANGPWAEVPWVLQRQWVRPGEAMDEPYLGYILSEKNFGVRRAEEAVRRVDLARSVLRPDDFQALRAYFERTLLTARLQAAAAQAYYGFRVWCRGGAYRTPFVTRTVRTGLGELARAAAAVEAYPLNPPAGQWQWRKDAAIARLYIDWITRSGWPRDPDSEVARIRAVLPEEALYPGFDGRIPNPNAGSVFKP